MRHQLPKLMAALALAGVPLGAAALTLPSIDEHATDPGHKLSASAKRSIEAQLDNLITESNVDVAAWISDAPEGQVVALGREAYKRWEIGDAWDSGVFFVFPASGRVHVVQDPGRPALTPAEEAELTAVDDPTKEMAPRLQRLIDVTQKILGPKLLVPGINGHMTDPGHKLSEPAKGAIEDALTKLMEDTHLDVAGWITNAPEDRIVALGNEAYQRWKIGDAWDNGVFFVFPASGRVHLIQDPVKPELTPVEEAKLIAADNPDIDLQKRIAQLTDASRGILVPKTQNKPRPWGKAHPERGLFYLLATAAIALAGLLMSLRPRTAVETWPDRPPPISIGIPKPTLAGTAARTARLALRLRAARQPLLVLAVVLAVWAPYLRSSRVDNRYGDWVQFSSYLGYELNALFHDHQFPFWVTDSRFEQQRRNGIHDFFANPETGVLSILTPLAELFGPLDAAKLSLVAYLMLGVLGCRRLLRALGGQGGFVSSVLLALLALCNGAMVGHVLVGHLNSLAVASFPLALALLLEALDPRLPGPQRRFRAALGGALASLAFYSGTTHYLFYFLLAFVGLLPLLMLLFTPRSWRTTLVAPLLFGAAFVTLSAFKLLPGLADLGSYHAQYHVAYDGWRQVASNLVTPWDFTWRTLSHEKNLYVGWAGAAVLGLSVLGILDRRAGPLLLACAATSFLMLLKPGSFLLRLPLLETQGVVTRPNVSLLMAIAAIAVVQLERLIARTRQSPRLNVRRGAAVALIGLTLFLAVDLSSESVARHVELGCTTSAPRPQGPFDQAPPLLPIDPQGTSVVADVTTANEFSYSYSRPGGPASTLLLSEVRLLGTRLPHLALRGDGKLTTHDGTLAVEVAGEQGHFTLYFSDPLIWWGLLISLLALVALVVLGIAARHPRPISGESAV